MAKMKGKDPKKGKRIAPPPPLLLIGGDNRFYEKYVPIADRLYDEYLKELQQEGLL